MNDLIGKRFMTKYGLSTAVHFEVFTTSFGEAKYVAEIPSDYYHCRIGLKLDTPENWICKASVAYFSLKDGKVDHCELV